MKKYSTEFFTIDGLCMRRGGKCQLIFYDFQ